MVFHLFPDSSHVMMKSWNCKEQELEPISSAFEFPLNLFFHVVSFTLVTLSYHKLYITLLWDAQRDVLVNCIYPCVLHLTSYVQQHLCLFRSLFQQCLQICSKPLLLRINSLYLWEQTELLYPESLMTDLG